MAEQVETLLENKVVTARSEVIAEVVYVLEVVCQKCEKWIRPPPMAGAEVSLSRF